MSASGNRESAQRLRTLQAAVREDWESVRENANRVADLLNQPLPDDVRAAAAATYLGRAYTGLEQVFQRIAQEFNGGSPQGSAWRRELLDLMARAVPEVRPSVISKALKSDLDEYRKFRHRVTHAYGAALEWPKMQPLVERLPAVMRATEAALQSFHHFIERLCKSINP